MTERHVDLNWSSPKADVAIRLAREMITAVVAPDGVHDADAVFGAALSGVMTDIANDMELMVHFVRIQAMLARAIVTAGVEAARERHLEGMERQEAQQFLTDLAFQSIELLAARERGEP